MASPLLCKTCESTVVARTLYPSLIPEKEKHPGSILYKKFPIQYNIGGVVAQSSQPRKRFYQQNIQSQVPHVKQGKSYTVEKIEDM